MQGALPNVGDPDSARPFIERRDYVWENQTLAAEVGYNDPSGTQVRWRKVYVPGPGGLDDPIQVIVENNSGTRNLYTYLRDEQLSVVGLVAEDETADPASPVIPVRYWYTPFGEAFVESSPQMELAEFESSVTNVAGATQTAGAGALEGSLLLRFGLPLDASTLAGGVALERNAGGGYVAVPGAEWVSDLSDGLNLRAMVLAGWERGVSYRLRLQQSLRDVLGRAPPLSGSEVEFAVPSGSAALVYEERFPVAYDSAVASSDAASGRFPGGQNRLFHGGWTDPVTGLVYFRARWYDAGSGSFLSEDPLGDVDSPNLYQYAKNSVFNGSDPLGLCFLGLSDRSCWDSLNRSGASAAGAVFGALESGVEAVAGLATLPGRMIEADTRRRRERLRAYSEGGYQAYSAAGGQQAEDMMATGKETAVGLLPLVGTFREGSRIAAECEGSGFDCGRQIGRTTLSATADVAVVAGTARLSRSAREVRTPGSPDLFSESGQIPYRSSDLSGEALSYRRANGMSGGRNVAVFEYVTPSGEFRTIARASERGIGHAERIIARELEAMGVDSSAVTRIYSELQPCGPIPGGFCARMIERDFPGASVSYSFEYGATPGSRRAGVDALKRAAEQSVEQ